MTGSFVAGFDSFTEKYSIVEEDTLDQLNEFRARISLGYLQGTFLEDYVNVEGQGLIGEESVEVAGRLDMLQRDDAYRFALMTDFSARTYRDNTTYTFANDFVRAEARAFIQRDQSEDFRIRLTDRVEIVDFDQRTEFDYDYVKNNLQLSTVLDHGFATSFRTMIGYVDKSVSDTTEISYKGYTGGLEFRRTFGLHRQVFVAVNGERRLYAHEPVKSPFWSFYSSADVQPFARGSFGVSLENAFEGYFYDEDTDVFFDYVENRSALQLQYFRSFDFTAGLGPTFGFLASESSVEDRYREVGVKLSVDYNAGGRIWVSASYEPGRRDYRTDSEELSLFSDFIYHRILVFATARVWEGTTVNLFVNHEPEDHEKEDDDTTATLFSLDLSYSF